MASGYGHSRYSYDPFGSDLEEIRLSVVRAQPSSTTTLRVIYSKDMQKDDPGAADDATNPANYDIRRGTDVITVTSVAVVSATTFDLSISELSIGTYYDLTVAETVAATSGETFAEELVYTPGANEYTFLGLWFLTYLDNSPYGQGRYSLQGYGREHYPYDPFDAMRVVVVEALDKASLQITYSRDMRRTNPLGYDDVTNPENYHIQSGVSILTVSSVQIISATTFILYVSGMLVGAEYLLTVDELVETEAGRPFKDELESNPTANQATFIGVGVVPQIVQITNPAAGFLQVVFNKLMLLNDEIQRATNYIITAVGESEEATVTNVIVAEETPNELLLQFTGGGGNYLLTVIGGIVDIAGNELHPGPYEFRIKYPSIDELFVSNFYFLETTLGAIKFTINKMSNRNIEDLTILRTMDKGYERQFQNIYEALKRAGINKDETRLKIFGA